VPEALSSWKQGPGFRISLLQNLDLKCMLPLQLCAGWELDKCIL